MDRGGIHSQDFPLLFFLLCFKPTGKFLLLIFVFNALPSIDNTWSIIYKLGRIINLFAAFGEHCPYKPNYVLPIYNYVKNICTLK